MQLWKHLLPVHQSISDYGASALMMYCTKDRTGELEKAAKVDETAAEYVRRAKRLSAALLTDFQDYERAMELKNLFSEALMYVRLCQRGEVEKIRESDRKSPDFKFKMPKHSVFIENKALNMSGGTLLHADIMQEGFEKKIEIEDKLKDLKERVVFSEQVFQPYLHAGGSDYDQFSTRLVIETLINKVNQNLKRDQFLLGHTLLLLDFSDQLLLHDSTLEHSQRTFTEPLTQNEVSGELWHLAFGKIGDQILKHIEFEGLSNNDGKLESSGLLISHSWIKGLIVHSNDTFLGFVFKQNSSAAVNEVLRTICSRVIQE